MLSNQYLRGFLRLINFLEKIYYFLKNGVGNGVFITNGVEFIFLNGVFIHIYSK